MTFWGVLLLFFTHRSSSTTSHCSLRMGYLRNVFDFWSFLSSPNSNKANYFFDLRGNTSGKSTYCTQFLGFSVNSIAHINQWFGVVSSCVLLKLNESDCSSFLSSFYDRDSTLSNGKKLLFRFSISDIIITLTTVCQLFNQSNPEFECNCCRQFFSDLWFSQRKKNKLTIQWDFDSVKFLKEM